MKYEIVANGTEMGTYEAETPAGAVAAYLRDAGYTARPSSYRKVSAEGVPESAKTASVGADETDWPRTSHNVDVFYK